MNSVDAQPASNDRMNKQDWIDIVLTLLFASVFISAVVAVAFYVGYVQGGNIERTKPHLCPEY